MYEIWDVSADDTGGLATGSQEGGRAVTPDTGRKLEPRGNHMERRLVLGSWMEDRRDGPLALEGRSNPGVNLRTADQCWLVYVGGIWGTYGSTKGGHRAYGQVQGPTQAGTSQKTAAELA